MSGGGDTPTKTLWKYEVLGLWNYGEFSNGNLYITGPEEGKIYNTDADGRISNIADLDQIGIDIAKTEFAKFFGEIQTVSVIVEQGLDVGDDVPNWESYELLE